VNRIILMASVSLDGRFEGPDGSLSWQTIDEELHQHFNDVLRPMGAFLDGRVTYELMAGYWPTADADPTATPAEVDFAGIWRDMPKVVYSRTLDSVAWHAELVREVLPEDVEELRARASGDLAVGGADLAATFLRLGLVDELRLYVHPVVLGAGRHLFSDSGGDLRLRLVGTRSFGSGVTLLHYAVD